ncbi:nickel transporter [Pleomorphomonas diazotrophica]|uniref:Nickel/cobalt efflux system n=1 Tax=Pleomorphomonas diazotrophica TaxID=1166257 RepID=A0A1I4VVZ6_9HYPH|nr:nickel/cobalt transporter [Pleomorphomonas diazotrophica]PKR89255.1 nickel transporter [Pleomorphomonas diazotrophica]SFN05189.1 ABC-type nickel/cobalt efflux system, permease component RcnA [Pleomorphomonas diazotrophica]
MPLTSRSLGLAAALCLVAAPALASTGPFGVGLPEPAASSALLPGLFRTIAGWQATFYRDLTATLAAMKADGSAGVWLMTLSFLYGVLHAAGPGHGKAVISTYVLANRETARNGALLAMVSALAQAVTAVVMVLIAAVLLGATSIAMTRAAAVLETGSFALIALLGLWLVWRKIARPLGVWLAERYAPVAVTVGGAPIVVTTSFSAAADHDGCGHEHRLGLKPARHVHDESCGHLHAPSPEVAAGRLDWRKAWTAIAAVGLRPCTGALIVLVFALSQGLLMAGIASAVTMALGTGVTVAALTLAAVTTRGLAVRLAAASGNEMAHRLHMAIEAGAAVAVLLFGLLMLGASLWG